MSDARARILGRLRAAPTTAIPERPAWSTDVPPEQRRERFEAALAASHAEVVAVTSADWPEVLAGKLAERGITEFLYAPATPHGQRLEAAWAGASVPRLVAYDRAIEEMKETLVHGVGGAITSTLGGIAETGTLILWPTPDEPRLMSLLPPLHVALVDAGRLYGTMTEAMVEGGWSNGMPTNALLISGPSKTADIEQTLAYGVHGPKDLLVLMVDGGI